MTTIEGAKKFDGRGKMEEPRDNEYANSNSVKYKQLSGLKPIEKKFSKRNTKRIYLILR